MWVLIVCIVDSAHSADTLTAIEPLPDQGVASLPLGPVPAGLHATQTIHFRAQAAARILGVRLQGLLATNEREFDAAFDTLRRSGAGALAISADPVFTAKSEQLAALTLRHKLPAVHESRRFTAAGGLLSYIGNTLESHRLAGIYTGRLLKGEKPTEVPIQTASKGEP
jgi:putative tryptophan/tyrosine transport system substrate-binding protein